MAEKDESQGTCERCHRAASRTSDIAGKREQICGESPYDARQPMWACRFGVVAYDEYHASHEHNEEGRCNV